MQEEIQATESNVYGDVARFFIDKYFPAKSVSAPVATPTPEPVAAAPVLGPSPLLLGSPLVIVAGLVICYFVFAK